MKAPDENQLKASYEALLASEARVATPPDIPPEVLQQLADGTYIGTDRDALIDRALAHEATAREFGFLLEVHRARPGSGAVAPVWRRWALAASVVGALALGARYVTVDPGPEPMRSSAADAVMVVSPASDAPFDSATTFTWLAVPDASGYRIDVVRDDGTAVAAATTRDTVLSVVPSVPLLPGEILRWWVTATLADGTTRRSTPAALRVR